MLLLLLSLGEPLLKRSAKREWPRPSEGIDEMDNSNIKKVCGVVFIFARNLSSDVDFDLENGACLWTCRRLVNINSKPDHEASQIKVAVPC